MHVATHERRELINEISAGVEWICWKIMEFTRVLTWSARKKYSHIIVIMRPCGMWKGTTWRDEQWKRRKYVNQEEDVGNWAFHLTLFLFCSFELSRLLECDKINSISSPQEGKLRLNTQVKARERWHQMLEHRPCTHTLCWSSLIHSRKINRPMSADGAHDREIETIFLRIMKMRQATGSELERK